MNFGLSRRVNPGETSKERQKSEVETSAPDLESSEQDVS
jgi:hypothetical protein